MLFTSWIYIVFLAITAYFYWTVPQKHRILLLLVASYVFYMSWSPPFGLMYGPLILLDSYYFYWLSRAMMRWPQHKKKILIVGVSSELLLLGYFKYTGFIVLTLSRILTWFHLPAIQWENEIFLPLAISFTNFILISYLVDVYRGSETPEPGPTRFLAYVAFFPHLIAGPIVRAKELLHQFDNPPPFSSERFAQGLHKFLVGMGIKLFIADQVAPYVNFIYGNQALQGFDTSWLATYAFAVQIFCDFAGYTLMAQGSALMLGYTLPENFDAPYFAKNITDFWRRWHMSLSRWLRDYLYIPLGGSRCSKFRAYRNLFITMGLGGLWHGASWTFVVWGLYQGLLLSLHKIFDACGVTRLVPSVISYVLTFHVVCIGWVFFRAQTFPNAAHLLSTMFNPQTALGISSLGKISFLIIVLFFVGHFIVRNLKDRVTNPALVIPVQAATYFLLIYLCVTMNTSKQEFIYFQF